MTFYKAGDRVRCIDREESDPVKIGDTGSVVDPCQFGPVVQWDVFREGMPYRSAYWAMTNEELEPE